MFCCVFPLELFCPSCCRFAPRYSSLIDGRPRRLRGHRARRYGPQRAHRWRCWRRPWGHFARASISPSSARLSFIAHNVMSSRRPLAHRRLLDCRRRRGRGAQIVGGRNLLGGSKCRLRPSSPLLAARVACCRACSSFPPQPQLAATAETANIMPIRESAPDQPPPRRSLRIAPNRPGPSSQHVHRYPRSRRAPICDTAADQAAPHITLVATVVEIW